MEADSPSIGGSQDNGVCYWRCTKRTSPARITTEGNDLKLHHTIMLWMSHAGEGDSERHKKKSQGRNFFISTIRIYNCKCDQVCTKVRPIGTVSHYSGNTPLLSLVASQHLCCKLSGLASSVAALHLAFPALTFMHCYGSLAGQTLPTLESGPRDHFAYAS